MKNNGDAGRLNALQEAIDDGNVETLSQIIARLGEAAPGMLNTYPEGGYSLLHQAASAGQAEVVKTLVTNGADVMARGADNKTALHVAAVEGHTDTVRALIESAGSKQKEMLNAQMSNGDTAAHLAARAGHADVVHALSRAGADVTIKNRNRQDVIEQAQAEVQKHLDAIAVQDHVLHAVGSHVSEATLPYDQIRTTTPTWETRMGNGNGHAASTKGRQ